MNPLMTEAQITEYITELKKLNLYELSDQETIVAFAMSQDLRQIKKDVPNFMFQLAYSEYSSQVPPTLNIIKLNLQDSIKEVFDVVNEYGVQKFIIALTQLHRAFDKIGESYVHRVPELISRIQSRFKALKLKSLDVDSSRSQFIPAYYRPNTDTIYFLGEHLSTLTYIVAGFPFILLHELAHLIEDCLVEIHLMSEQVTQASLSDQDKIIELKQSSAHCARYKMVLLLLSFEIGFIRSSIFEKLKRIIVEDVDKPLSEKEDPSLWQQGVITELKTNTKFKLRSEVHTVTWKRFSSEMIARKNFSNTKALASKIAVNLDGLYNLYDSELAPLDTLIAFSTKGVVSKDHTPIILNEVGLYLIFVEDQDCFVFLYIDPNQLETIVNFAEAYWLLH